ncbi:unnamed protein product [Bubo scandiacus]
MARPSSGAVAWEVPAPRKRLHQPKTVPRQGEGLLGKGEALRYGKGSSPRWNGELAYREDSPVCPAFNLKDYWTRAMMESSEPELGVFSEKGDGRKIRRSRERGWLSKLPVVSGNFRNETRDGGETKRVQKNVSWWMPAQGMDVIALAIYLPERCPEVLPEQQEQPEKRLMKDMA